MMRIVSSSGWAGHRKGSEKGPETRIIAAYDYEGVNERWNLCRVPGPMC